MWFGVKHSDGEIVIHKKYTKIINGILEREAFRLFLPKKVTSLRFGFDLAMLYTYSKLPKKHKRKWMELWNLYKISFDFVSNLTYKAPEMLLQLYTINKNKFIDDMKLFTSIKLYERNVLSLGKAAALAERDVGEFMEMLSDYGVDVIKYPKEELNEEIKFLRTV